ncbi:MAG TPA: phytanoyl-CoA dioxygenase family protein [Abditibacteriaceae bacterium]|jgi:ectoine hydroxylase-related dioxygenase (phytanoyl-CoA dioxygenase family)
MFTSTITAAEYATTRPAVTIEQLEVFADDLDAQKASAIYKEHGALIVRGLMKPYLAKINRDIEMTVQQSLSLLDKARQTREGWITPDGTLFLPAPANFARDKQIMVLALRYNTSAAFFRSAFDEKLLNIVEAIIGPNIEMFMDGQCLYKEPVGGHPKNLHQDSAYFDHRFDGPTGVLNYCVDTDLSNGALHVVPGSHHFGTLKHIDTFSHLGLDETDWPWESALPLCGQAGDSIFFHYRTIHGSKENHSPGPRPVFIHRYRRPDDYVTIGATTTGNREEAEQKAREARKSQQKGLMVRGFRPYEDD